jgi:hypothetical protein
VGQWQWDRHSKGFAAHLLRLKERLCCMRGITAKLVQLINCWCMSHLKIGSGGLASANYVVASNQRWATDHRAQARSCIQHAPVGLVGLGVNVAVTAYCPAVA